jgi:sialate O-acetylesterase
MMISHWRRSFGNPSLPFAFVQLAAFASHDFDFSQIRLTQTEALNLNNVFMITASDLGDPTSIYIPVHPRNKQEVGRRLGRALIKHLYHDTSITRVSPSAIDTKISYHSNDWNLRVDFNYDSTDLYSKGTAFCTKCCDESPIEVLINSTWNRMPFEISSKNSIRINGAGLLPTAIRGMWGAYPECSFYNSENFAVSPFYLEVLPF